MKETGKHRPDLWERKDEIINLYKNISSIQIAKMFNCSDMTIYKILRKENIKIKGGNFFLKGKRISIKTEFKKGDAPWNKNKTGIYSEETIKKMRLACLERENVLKGKTFEEYYGEERAKEIRRTSSKAHKGQKSSFKGKHHSKKAKAKLRLTWLGKKNPEHARRMLGEKNHQWLGGISFEPYGIEFNDKFKRKIRQRDNHTCQECGKTQKELKRELQIHHIDYQKQNNNPLNLIALCVGCHAKTNYNRKHWKRYFKNIMALREVFNLDNVLIFNENKQLIGMEKI